MAARDVVHRETNESRRETRAPSVLPAASQPDGGSCERTDADQIAERLSWTPSQRLRYLLDMLEFEQRARRARRIP